MEFLFLIPKTDSQIEHAVFLFLSLIKVWFSFDLSIDERRFISLADRFLYIDKTGQCCNLGLV